MVSRSLPSRAGTPFLGLPWDRVSAGSQHPLPRPAPQTPLWFSVPPSISKDDPTGEVGVKEVKTKVNSTLSLECECWATPPPTISWYKDGRVSAGPSGRPLGPPVLLGIFQKRQSKHLAPELAWVLCHPLHFNPKSYSFRD